MENRRRGLRIAAALWMLMVLLAVSAYALAEDPIRVSSLSEPQSVISEQDVSITIKLYNGSQQDMTDPIVLYAPDRHSVDEYSGLGAEQSVTYTGTWHVTKEEIDAGKINYFVKFTVEENGEKKEQVRYVPVTIQTESAAPQLTATYAVSPSAARKGQTVTLAYTLLNTGNVELRNIAVANKGVSSKELTAASLSVGEKIILSDTVTMGEKELVSQPKITYQAAGEKKQLTISDLPRKVIAVAQNGLELSAEAKNAENVYPGESVNVTLKLKNSGSTDYSGLTVTMSDGTVAASNVSLAAGKSTEVTAAVTPTDSMTLTAKAEGTDANGEAVYAESEAITITTQDPAGALILDVTAQAQTTVIHEEPAVVRFGVMVKNIGQTDAATLTIKEAGTTVATIPSLPSGESRSVVFDVQTSIAGQIQFTVSGKDASGNEKAYTSNVVALTYVAPTPVPTHTPAPTTPPPTPSPVPTATPVPTLGEMIAARVNLTVLYAVAGVLAAVIAAVVVVSSLSEAARKRRMKNALDTMELTPDVRDSAARRRRRTQKPAETKGAKSADKQASKTEKVKPDAKPDAKNDAKLEKKAEEAPETKTDAPKAEAPKVKETEENPRRRANANISDGKTLRVAPVTERPEFVPQGKVDDSATRVFGKLDVQREAEKMKTAEQKAQPAGETETVRTDRVKVEKPAETAQETIRLSRDEVENLRQQAAEKAEQRKDRSAQAGKTRKEIKPMKKKGFFGRRKDEEDDFLEEPQADEFDDDDLFE